jgi:predicted HicB family RNase H-like nuclease
LIRPDLAGSFGRSPEVLARQSLDQLSHLLHSFHYHRVVGEALLSPDQTRHTVQFPLRLAKSLREAANAVATQQGISLNHFIALALAEKISRGEHQAPSSPNNALRKDIDDRKTKQPDASSSVGKS